MSPRLRAWAVDTGERVLASFGEAVVAAVAAGALAKGVNADTVHVVLIAGLTAGATVLKAALASIAHGTVSPASLAPAQQPGQVEQDAPPDVVEDDTARNDFRISYTRPPTSGFTGYTITKPLGLTSLTLHDRLALLPAPTGRKGGLLPSPRDDRDYRAKLPTKIPAACNFGAGIAWGMLLNDRIGDCYPVALLHALQVLTGGTYTPTDADALHVYEQVTGYDPTRTDANGNNPTDQGTYGRQLFAWAKQRGLITAYATVPANRTAVRAAIAAHKAVLCEWALPVGAEREGDIWTMPRTGRVAGSWGGHATVEVGYTATRNRNVTWGEQGTVTPAFEDAYLQAAWVVAAPASLPPVIG